VAVKTRSHTDLNNLHSNGTIHDVEDDGNNKDLRLENEHEKIQIEE
jgi:hypothetical protein